ncbi:hypothetical protein DL96DRAFT_1194078 [Flagelloscypha sp. PMI_526]|nr:hypothetical protein DL96DRAFT_1194078 [Flagelloscypha sp. PMI_526]
MSNIPRFSGLSIQLEFGGAMQCSVIRAFPGAQSRFIHREFTIWLPTQNGKHIESSLMAKVDSCVCGCAESRGSTYVELYRLRMDGFKRPLAYMQFPKIPRNSLLSLIGAFPESHKHRDLYRTCQSLLLYRGFQGMVLAHLKYAVTVLCTRYTMYSLFKATASTSTLRLDDVEYQSKMVSARSNVNLAGHKSYWP